MALPTFEAHGVLVQVKRTEKAGRLATSDVPAKGALLKEAYRLFCVWFLVLEGDAVRYVHFGMDHGSIVLILDLLQDVGVKVYAQALVLHCAVLIGTQNILTSSYVSENIVASTSQFFELDWIAAA